MRACVYYLICLNYVLRSPIDLIKENGFILKKKKQEAYDNPQKTDSTDDLELLINTPALVESLLKSLEQAARGISFNVNADKQSSCVSNKIEPFPL